MTITIDVCWADHIGSWFDRNSEKISDVLFAIMIFGSVPVFIISILVLADLVDVPMSGVFEALLVSVGLVMGGFGTFISVAYTIAYLYEENEKKHWFKIKHCEDSKN